MIFYMRKERGILRFIDQDSLTFIEVCFNSLIVIKMKYVSSNHILKICDNDSGKYIQKIMG